jgi:hypothetical protein
MKQDNNVTVPEDIYTVSHYHNHCEVNFHINKQIYFSLSLF